MKAHVIRFEHRTAIENRRERFLEVLHVRIPQLEISAIIRFPVLVEINENVQAAEELAILDDVEVEMHIKGPSDVLQSLLVFQPGGDTGWHTHPGPVVVVVKSGALTEFENNGCVTVHPTGSVFFESANVVHRAVNQTGSVSEVYATFISPTGMAPLIPANDPGGTCRHGHNK
jgi:quercetin dioxygenase-like cupin family protein